MHKVGVYCFDCSAWVKWGYINKNNKEATKMYEINHEEAFEGNGLMKEGDYEVVVKKAEEKETKDGAVYISLDLVVRNDVEQQYKNKHLFHSLWKTKATGEYNKPMISTVAKSLDIPNGTKFSSLEELLAGFVNKVCKVTIKHETYNGNVNERVKAWGPTKFPACNHLFKDTEKVSISQDDDDLPF
jgi:hypothetical protein